ncbi:hypothetical protein MSSIT_2817 [Methanosarcina siciliae T4/M]|uniref:Uncharacterized protein n=2 Tax=Methanosarcina siciliae TaxID=38027 RepID=A0A0E3LBB3_9EURY|nr:hypothetical protein MSSIT_2817 [Methanosarcina siciliae T4/M]AKB33471.1 hypothetical protein MSSIH_2781 [Methanosarcina siciliae HI350]
MILLFSAGKMHESCKQGNFVQIEDLIANKVNCSGSDENPLILLYLKLKNLITIINSHHKLEKMIMT